VQYLFQFLLMSCLAVGVVTTVFAFALFFRYKSRLEYYFLTFLSFFTLRVFADAAVFFLFPFRPPADALLYAAAFLSRITLVGTLVFMTLFMHQLTGLFQTAVGRGVVSALAAALFLAYAAQFVLDLARRSSAYPDPYLFLPVDFAFYVLALYPFVVFFLFSRRIKSITIYRMVRTLIILILAAFPLLILDDVLGSVLALIGVARRGPLPFRLFPLCYLMIYAFFLRSGFKNYVSENRLASAGAGSSRAFVEHFGITAREQEVIELMRQGLRNREIAAKLFISTATVKNHFHNVFEKTGAVNRVELIRLSVSR
jgi:DNA-binding CsgD family transcriptional regulator